MTTNTTKIALVTGASRGLGRNMAIALGRKGMKGPFRTLNAGNVANAVACWLLGQPIERRHEIIKTGLKLYQSAIDMEPEDRADFEVLLRTHGEPKYTGLPPTRLPGKKSRGANGAVG